MKLLLSSFALLCSMSMVAQDRDRSPSVPPVATAAQAVVNDPASSVTGATVPPNNRPIALKIVGSNVKNLKGEYLGLIEEVALNPESKQIEYALLNTEYPTNSGRVTPVPWQALSYVWDQSQVGGAPGAVQLFRLDVDRGRLTQAPKIEKTQFTQLLQPGFRQQLIAFYGGSIENVGATGTEVATSSGSASGGSTVATVPGVAADATETGYGGVAYVGAAPGGVFLLGDGTTSTNRVAFNVTNINTVTNIINPGTNVATGTNISNTGTNMIVSGGTNIFQPGSPGTNMATNQGPMVANTNTTGRGPSNAVAVSVLRSNQFLRRTLQQGPADTGASGSGTTTQTGSGVSGTSGAGNRSPWTPPNTVIMPGGQPAVPPSTSSGNGLGGNPAQGLTLPNPPGPLPLPNPVGPLPFPTPDRSGTLPPVSSPPGAVPATR